MSSHAADRTTTCRRLIPPIILCLCLIPPAPLIVGSESRPESPLPSQNERTPRVTFDRGYLSVSAHDATLQEILTAIGRAGGFEIEWKGSEGRQRVSLSFDSRPLVDALNELLSGRNYLLFYKGRGKDKQVSKVVIVPGSASSSFVPVGEPAPTVPGTASSYREREVPESSPPRSDPEERRQRELMDQPGGTGLPQTGASSTPMVGQPPAMAPVQPSSPFPYLNAIQQQNQARQAREKSGSPSVPPENP